MMNGNAGEILLKRYTDRGVSKLLQALQSRLDEDEKSGKLKELIDAKDTFGKLLPVYSIGDNKRIRLMWCEHYGYPNVTTGGELMYENIFYSQLKAAKYHLLRNTKMNWWRWWRYNVRGRFKVIGEQFKLFFKYDLREIWECVYVRCWGVFFVKGGEDGMPKCAIQRDIVLRMLCDKPINQRTIDICRDFVLHGTLCPYMKTERKKYTKKVKNQKTLQL